MTAPALVVWKITPLVAEYLASPDNVFRATGVLSQASNVLELGCGISGLVGLAVSSAVQSYTLTDQSYVARFVDKNLSENAPVASGKSGQKRKGKSAASSHATHNLRFKPLDWELDQVTSSLAEGTGAHSFDVVLACDCIYNEALIQPLVQTCADACRLRRNGDDSADGPAICLVAQQLRDPDIFEAWIREFHKSFRAWRLPDEALSPSLRSSPGFVVHLGILRD